MKKKILPDPVAAIHAITHTQIIYIVVMCAVRFFYAHVLFYIRTRVKNNVIFGTALTAYTRILYNEILFEIMFRYALPADFNGLIAFKIQKERVCVAGTKHAHKYYFVIYQLDSNCNHIVVVI